MQEIKDKLDLSVVYICKVMRSCVTLEQLDNAYQWGLDAINAIHDNLRCKDPVYYHHTHGIAPLISTARGSLWQCYGGIKIALNSGQPADQADAFNNESVPFINICPSCGGTGITPKDGTHECHHCSGSGRVKMMKVIRTRMKPFVPGEDDPRLPIKW